MPGNLLKGFSRVVFWRFERGSWQYDILCGLILVFIFLTPKEVFDGRAFMEKIDSLKTAEQRTSNILLRQ
jgi:hypothetical protein